MKPFASDRNGVGQLSRPEETNLSTIELTLEAQLMTGKMEKYNWLELDKVCLSFHYTEPFVMDDNLWAWHLDDTVPRKVEELYLVNFFKEGISAVRERNRRFQRGVIGVLYISLFALVAYGWHTHSLSFMGFLYEAVPAEYHRLISLLRTVFYTSFGLVYLYLLAMAYGYRNSLSGQSLREFSIYLLLTINTLIAANLFLSVVFRYYS